MFGQCFKHFSPVSKYQMRTDRMTLPVRKIYRDLYFSALDTVKTEAGTDSLDERTEVRSGTSRDTSAVSVNVLELFL